MRVWSLLQLTFETIQFYKELLGLVKSAVTKNYAEKSLNNILDLVSASQDMAFLEEFYSITLQSLEDLKNDVSFRIAHLA